MEQYRPVGAFSVMSENAFEEALGDDSYADDHEH